MMRRRLNPARHKHRQRRVLRHDNPNGTMDVFLERDRCLPWDQVVATNRYIRKPKRHNT
jgi:hypothetical protein